MNKTMKISFLAALLLLSLCGQTLRAQPVHEAAPVIIIASDWDKPPYEFRNDEGHPAGFYVDVITAILDQMEQPYQFQMVEASRAIALFEQGKADLIFDNARKYRDSPYFCTSNIISYYRMSVATAKDTTGIISVKALENPKEAVFYHGGYAAQFFKDEIPDHLHLNYQPPKEALAGLVKGRYKYFVWNEAALNWKIRELNLEDQITLHEVNIPVGEIHIIGRDKQLIDAIDDHYSRLKERGIIAQMSDKWFHPERVHKDTSTLTLPIAISIFILAGIIYLLVRIAKAHVRFVTRTSTEVNKMMHKALQMGSFHVTEYDIRRNLFTNTHGSILPGRGITLEEYIAHIHPDEQAEFMQQMKLLLGGREREFEIEKHWNAGTLAAPRWLRFSGHLVVELDHEGHPEYIINVIHDNTQSEEKEKKHHDIQRRFHTLFNIPSLAMSFYNKSGWLITLNEAMKTLCRFENPDNKRFWTTMNMHDAPLLREAYTPSRENQPLQMCQRMDYPELGIKNYIEINIVPVQDSQGKTTQYLSTALDIASQQALSADISKLQKALAGYHQQIEHYETRLHHLLTSSNIYICTVDFLSRQIVFTHSLRQKDYTIHIDDYLQMVDETEHDEAAAHLIPGLDELSSCDGRHTSLVATRRLTRTLSSDTPQWISYMLKKTTDSEGIHTGYTGLAVVVTNLLDTQKRLRETAETAKDSIRLKSLFLASMTHELRTPLNAIVGFTTLLQTTQQPAEREELIHIILDSCDMLERLINDILEASAITAETPATIQPADVNFAKTFDHICHTLQQRVEQAHLQFQKDNPYDNLYTTVDAGRIQQIITNFVTNAVKFTRQGHVRLGYRYERHGLRIYCQDTGTGIPRDKQEVIFDRFVKLDEFIQGTGMGLNICKALTQRMGGQIGVDSDGTDGAGSTFWIWIPCERRLSQAKN